MARALEVLLRRAQFDPSPCSALIGELADQERIELMRSYGRIEPRSRFKRGASHPLLAGWPINGLFLDEAGKSFPEQLGPQAFALAGIAMRDEDIDTYVAAADRLKEVFFGHTNITFHEPRMRNHDGVFHFEGDPTRQQAFDTAVDELIASTPFVAFGVGVRKAAIAPYFTEAGLDPYLPTDAYALAIVLLLERYVGRTPPNGGSGV